MAMLLAIMGAIVLLVASVVSWRLWTRHQERANDMRRKDIYRTRERHWFAQNLFFFRRTQRRLTHRPRQSQDD